jgi:hypothetical protein
MPEMRFKKLTPRLKLTATKTPKTIEKRVEKIESDILDLRSILRELIEIIEKELFTDIDRDSRIGHVGGRNPLPKARLEPIRTPRSRLERKPAPLGPNIP